MVIDYATERKWLFMSTPKCATNSMYKILRKDSIGMKIGAGFHPRTTERLAKLQFTVCRNPYSRVVSMWASTCMRGNDRYHAIEEIEKNGGDYTNLEHFLRFCLLSDFESKGTGLFMSQTDIQKQMLLDKVIHMENLEDELRQILKFDFVLAKRNPSKHKPWQEYMTPRIIKLINNWDYGVFKYGYERL